MSSPLLHLASSSPRRRELLAALGLEFSYAGVAVDESALPGEAASDMVVRLATSKAGTAYDSGEHRLPVLGADTVVVLGERVFGKPGSKEEALSMLASLSGRTHQVLTGVAVIADGELQTAVQGLGGIFVSAINGSYTGVVGLPVFETVNLLRQAGIELPAMRNHR
jgi:septum formation protein